MDIIEEYSKCLVDIGYYGERYCVAFDQTRGGKVKLELFPKQKELMKHYQKNRFSVVLKPRQAGVSTVSALYCAHKILFALKTSPQKILIVANKLATAQEFLKKLKDYIATRPEWLGVEVTKDAAAEIVLSNGSGAKATATSTDALRGYTPTILVMDEAAFIERADELWTSAAASLSTGGRAIFISTPNGLDPLYYKTYQAALSNKNDFKVFEMNWWQDPRFNKDLELKREIKNEVQKEINGKLTVVNEITVETVKAKSHESDNWCFDDIKRLIKDGYEPTSEWFRGMCRTYNDDQRKIAQELKCSFLGSGDNVIDEQYIKQQELNVELPIRTGFFDNNLHIFEEPKQNNQYMLCSDVSRGDSADFSTIEIWNMDTGEQAAEWEGKVQPDILGEMINEIGLQYQAYAIVDITGGMGVGTVKKLLDLKYPWVHYDDGSKNNVLKGQMGSYANPNDKDKIPGFIIGPQRTLIIQALELAIRTGAIKIKSKRLINQLRTFVYINGKPDHMRGYHDDLLIAVAMILYVFQFSFKNVKRYNAQTLAILNAYDISTTVRPSVHNSSIDNNFHDDTSWLIGLSN